MCAMPTNEQPVSGPSRPPGIRSRRASRPRRDASPRRDRRQALIDAAIEMFTEDGSADISAAAVARRADVAHGLLFYYFTDKKGLVAAALVDMLDELAAYQSPRPEEKTERERLEGFVRRHVEFLDRYRMAYLRVIREGVFATPEINRAVQQARSNAADQVTELPGLAKPGSARGRVAVSGWIGFLDRLADEYIDDPELDLDSVVVLAADAFDAVVNAARISGCADL